MTSDIDKVTPLELARRAVACKGWRWMAGMKLADTDDTYRLTYIFVEDLDEVRPILEPPNGWGWPKLGSGWLPDLSDPATLGCLLALVREAVGSAKVHVEPHGILWHCYASEHRIGDGSTEVEALVAALEAAP